MGGVAAAAHGSARSTYDVDVVYARSADNMTRLAETLAPLEPYLRGAPAGLPFRWDAETIAHGLNFTLTTTLGDLDVLGEIVGGGGYEQLSPHSTRMSLFGHEVRCLDLDTLIRVRTRGRPAEGFRRYRRTGSAAGRTTRKAAIASGRTVMACPYEHFVVRPDASHRVLVPDGTPE